ncbi:hypothetical protein [Micromonospora halophytica]|uniref:Uncharacterized protein n=1 Tax=Micromonospora halophytica TaxID=47864 RepID=A0A1C5HK96_9ACTN|nr:hypothetical protein [Micromonospora halophytica]SCG45981.1 hypothetical protein GA0070560_104276 [Micromonospora halophytica]
MSEQTRPQSRTAPAGVTDPLLWRLAADVAQAHQPDRTGHCDNLLCARQEWPCEAARNARRALEMSGVTAEETAAPRRAESERPLPAPPHRRSRAAAEAA